MSGTAQVVAEAADTSQGMRSYEFQVMLGGERAEKLKELLGSRTVPVCSPCKELAVLPDHDGEVEVYRLNFKALEIRQQKALVNHLADEFEAPQAEIEKAIRAEGHPLIAEECNLIIQNPQRWL